MAKKKKHKEVLLEQMNIFLPIPTESVCIEIIAQFLDKDGKLKKVRTTLSASEIRQKRQDFLDNVEFGDDYDGKFVITEEGKRYLEEMAQAKHMQEGR